MPDVSYSPNQGRVSRVNAEDQINSQMQDFLLRKAIADQQANLTREGFGMQRELAQSAGDRAERMQGNEIGANRDIQGTFGDRSSAQMALADKTIGGQRDIAGIGARSALDVAREGNAPQIAALDFQRSVYGDKRADEAVKRAIDAAQGNQRLQIMGLPPVDSVQSGGARSGAPVSGQPIPATSAGTPPPMEARGVPTGNASALVDAVTLAQRNEAGGPRRAIPGEKQYEFDTKSARTQASMLDQLKGQVDPVRWQQAVDQLDNSRKQQSQRDLDRMASAPPPVDQAAVRRVVEGTVRGSMPSGEMPKWMESLSPDQRADLAAQAAGLTLKQSPVKAAEEAKQIADIQAGPVGAIAKKGELLGAQGNLRNQILETPEFKQGIAEMGRARSSADLGAFRRGAETLRDLLISGGLDERTAASIIQATVDEQAPSIPGELLRRPLSGVFNIPDVLRMQEVGR